MSINTHALRKNIVLTLWPVLGAVFFFGGTLTYGLWGGLAFMLGFALGGFYLGKLLLQNAFSDALEGRGLLVIDLSSKGVLPSFCVQLEGRNIRNKKKILTHFNREIVHSLRPPVMAPKKTLGERIRTRFSRKKEEQQTTSQYVFSGVRLPPSLDVLPADIEIKKSGASLLPGGAVRIDITGEEYQESRMRLDTLPVIFCNFQTGMFLTKDFLATFERESTILHALVDTYHKLERLEHHMLDFGRYVVQAATGEANNWWRSPKLWVVLIILGMALMGYFLWPSLSGAFKGISGGL